MKTTPWNFGISRYSTQVKWPKHTYAQLCPTVQKPWNGTEQQLLQLSLEKLCATDTVVLVCDKVERFSWRNPINTASIISKRFQSKCKINPWDITWKSMNGDDPICLDASMCEFASLLGWEYDLQWFAFSLWYAIIGNDAGFKVSDISKRVELFDLFVPPD